MRRIVGVALVAGGLVVACGDDGGLPNVDELACDDAGACDDAVGVAGRAYSVSCAEPDEASLGERVADPGNDGRFDGARAVDGEDAARVVALPTRGDGVERCGDRRYVLAIEGSWADHEAIRRLLCVDAAVPDAAWCADDAEDAEVAGQADGAGAPGAHSRASTSRGARVSSPTGPSTA